MTLLQPEIQEENRRIRQLRIMTDLLIQLLMTGSVSMSEADSMICGVKEFAMRLFPGKDPEFELIYMPRFRRALLESGAYDGNLALRVIEGGRSVGNKPKTQTNSSPLTFWCLNTILISEGEND